MFSRIGTKILITAILLVPAMLMATLNLYAQATEKSVSGTLSAQLDSERGTVTAMFVGHTGGSPLVVGPYSWDMSRKEFAGATAMAIGKRLFGSDHSIRKVTKSAKSGKEIVANIIIENRKAPAVVGR